MGFGCPICSEQLHRLPAEATTRNSANQPGSETDINISATPCGHLFHTYCINKWLSGNLASSKQCPCCRKAVPGLRVLPLYPNGYDDSILDDSLSQQSGGGPCDHSNFNITIGSLRSQLSQFQSKFEEAEIMLKIQTDVADEIKKKYKKEKVRSEHLTLQWKQYESYKDYSEEKERECKEISSKLKNYQMIDALVKGLKDTVDDELKNYPPSYESFRDLVQVTEVLKQELTSASKKQNDIKKEQEDGRSERQKLHSRLQSMQSAYDELRRVYEGSFNSSAAKLASEERVYNVMHVNRTPLLMASKVSRKLVLNHEDDPIDEDVSLIQPFVFKTKAKTKSGTTRSNSKPSSTVTSSGSSSSSEPLKLTSSLVKPAKNPVSALSDDVMKNICLNKNSDSRKRKSGDVDQKSLKKIQKTTTEILPKDMPKQINRLVDEWMNESSSSSNSPDEILPSRKINIQMYKASTSKATTSKSHIAKKISKLTNCDISPLSLNQTIQLSSDDDDETFSPMQLKGNIPGLKVTPFDRPSFKSAAGRAMMHGFNSRNK